jgi:hypothetical protein
MILHRFLSVCLLMVIGLLMTNGLCRADIPTTEQECRIRNSAVFQSNGIQFLVDGGCPNTAQTVRPAGQERCEAVSGNVEVSAQSQPDKTTSQFVSRNAEAPVGPQPDQAVVRRAPLSPQKDLAWVGRMERWLLPSLISFGCLLIVCAVFFTIRRIRQHRHAGNVLSLAIRSALIISLSAIVAVIAAYQTAATVFHRVFSSFDNHDTAAPVLIAAPVAFIVFLLVLSGLSAFMVWMLNTLLKSPLEASPRNPPSSASGK